MRRLLVALLFSGCVPLVPLADAPCPCGPGATCCETLAQCIPDGATCPATIPSTMDDCQSNADCGPREACAAWTLDDGSLAGPRVCRRRCTSESCDGDERCLFTLADGRPADELAISKLCLDVQPGCEAWTCEGCGDLALGEVTMCTGASDQFGCLFALHPECGLKCERRQIGSCDNLVSPCVLYSCDNCPGGKPGPPICDMGTERTCLVTTMSGREDCDRLCIPEETGACNL